MMKKLWTLLFLCVHVFAAASTTVIGIAGASGAGKTTLAKKLKETLGEHVVMICQDSYYKDLSHLPLLQRAKTNFDAPQSIDFDLLKAHLLALKSGETVEQPIYDFKTHSRLKETVLVSPQKILIVEGALLFAIPEIRELCDMKLFIDVDLDICLCRRIERDQKERGRTFLDIRDQYFSTVRPMFMKFVAPSKAFADLIIPNENENVMALEFISSKLYQVIAPSLTARYEKEEKPFNHGIGS